MQNKFVSKENYQFVTVDASYQKKIELISKNSDLNQLSVDIQEQQIDSISLDEDDSLKLISTSVFYIDFCFNLKKLICLSDSQNRGTLLKIAEGQTLELISKLKDDIIGLKAIETGRIANGNQKVVCAMAAAVSLITFLWEEIRLLAGDKTQTEAEMEGKKVIKQSLEKIEELCDQSLKNGLTHLAQINFANYPVMKNKNERNEYANEFFNVNYVFVSAKKCFFSKTLSITFERVVNNIISSLNKQVILAGIKPDNFDSSQLKQFKKDLTLIKKMIVVIDCYENERNKELIEQIIDKHVPKKEKDEE